MPTRLVPARPTITAPCTCIWQELAKQHAAEDAEQKSRDENPPKTILEQARDAVPNPLAAIPGTFLKADQPEPPTVVNPPASPATTTHRDASTPPAEDKNATDARQARKAKALKKTGGLAGQKHADVLIRAFKKRLSKSSENKLGSLISYREDLVNTLTSLVPSSSKHNPRGVHLPVIRPVPNTTLCTTCMTNLAYALYYSPAVRTPYIREHSTAAYLALVDDAVSALNADDRLEHITHNQLDSILRVELAVVEWRLTLKLARYHKRSGFLDMFPVRIGEFAELEVTERRPVQSESLLKKAGKTIVSAVGFGTDSLPTPQQGVQAVADAV